MKPVFAGGEVKNPTFFQMIQAPLRRVTVHVDHITQKGLRRRRSQDFQRDRLCSGADGTLGVKFDIMRDIRRITTSRSATFIPCTHIIQLPHQKQGADCGGFRTD